MPRPKNQNKTDIISFRVATPIKTALVKIARHQRVTLAELMAEIAVGSVRK